MIKKLVLIFVIFFVSSFSILNGRFIISNLRFYFSEETFTVNDFPVRGSSQTARGTKTAIDAPLFERLDASAILFIPRIGVTAPIIFDSPADHPGVYKSLELGVVNYPITSKPGEKGVSVILGHSSALPWYPGDYGSVFSLLGKLKTGDVFWVQYRDGLTFNYIVKKTLIYSLLSGEEDINSLVDGYKSSVILVSCWPIDIDYKRIAIEAELVK